MFLVKISKAFGHNLRGFGQNLLGFGRNNKLLDKNFKGFCQKLEGFVDISNIVFDPDNQIYFIKFIKNLNN